MSVPNLEVDIEKSSKIALELLIIYVDGKFWEEDKMKGWTWW